MRALRLLVLLATFAAGGVLLAPAAGADPGSPVTFRAPWKGAWHRPGVVPVVRTPARAPLPRPTPAAVPTPTPSSASSDLTGFAVEVLALVNAERAAVGLQALRPSTCAEGFAVRWSQQMASTGAFVHQSLSPLMSGCQARGAGENIAYGARTPTELMTMWMGSPGHRANILRASFTHLGVGIARSGTGRLYATQDFLTL